MELNHLPNEATLSKEHVQPIHSSDSEEAPHSMQAGAARAWGEVVHEAAARSGIAQAFDGTPVESTLPPGLHLDGLRV